MDALQKKLKELREVGERGKGRLSVSREWYMNVIEALEEADYALEKASRLTGRVGQTFARLAREKIAKKLGVGSE